MSTSTATRAKLVAYSVASVSGTILAVCSCTVLPLFAGVFGVVLSTAAGMIYGNFIA